MEEQPRRHAGRRTRPGSSGNPVRSVLTGALFSAALLGTALVLDSQGFKDFLDVRLGPGGGMQEDAPPAGTAEEAGGQPARARTGAPPPGVEEQDSPLGTPAPPRVGSDAYRFLAVNADGGPVGYSPCRPLHYVVNDTLAPEGAQQLIAEAVEDISAATGITFVYDGTTAELPSPQRRPYQPDAYGERWAPLLMAWTTPEVTPQLKGQVIGTGGSTHYSYDDGLKTFVTGSLDLDAPQIADELLNPGGHLYATAVILHELSHVMGLDHVEDPTQLMYPEIGTPEGLSAGDLNGLFELSKAQCRKDL